MVLLYRSLPEVFYIEDIFRNFAKFIGKHLCQSLFFNKVAGLRHKACNFIKKETLAQLFSCEFCQISKNTIFYRTPPVVAFFTIYFSFLKRFISDYSIAIFYFIGSFTIFILRNISCLEVKILSKSNSSTLSLRLGFTRVIHMNAEIK